MSRLAAAVLVSVLAVAGGCSGAEGSADASSPEPTQTAPSSTPTPDDPYTPTPQDFQVELDVVNEECLGDGCVLSVRPDLTHQGPEPLDPDRTFAVYYEILGGDEDDGGVLVVEDGDKYRGSGFANLVRTESADSELTAVVTEVTVE